ncbi:MAG: TraB family protein, partial [Erysipelothrix sp.]|nr:TraB family protein [Erysipelothrix sp.]
RVWNKFNLWKKLNLGVSLFATLLDDTEVSEEDIEKLKESDMLMATIEDLEGEFPEISEVILHERNYYMAEKIKNIPYSTMVVVIGAAHTKGMIAAFDETHDLKELETVVEKKKNNWIGFILPGTLLLLITLLTLKSPQMAFQELLAWIITSSSLAALGALLSGAHIVTILVSFLTAFIGILSPVLAVGIFAGLTEAYFRPPFAKEFESLSSDMKSIKGWYKNRVLRIILIFFMTSILSSIGSFVAGKNIIQSLFK